MWQANMIICAFIGMANSPEFTKNRGYFEMVDYINQLKSGNNRQMLSVALWNQKISNEAVCCLIQIINTNDAISIVKSYNPKSWTWKIAVEELLNHPKDKLTEFLKDECLKEHNEEARSFLYLSLSKKHWNSLLIYAYLDLNNNTPIQYVLPCNHPQGHRKPPRLLSNYAKNYLISINTKYLIELSLTKF